MKRVSEFNQGIWVQSLLYTSLKDHMAASFELNGVVTFSGSFKVLFKSLSSILTSFESPIIPENVSHLVIASASTEVQRICAAKIINDSGEEVALGERFGLTRSSFSGRSSKLDVLAVIFFVPLILCVGLLTLQLSPRSAIWRFPAALMEAQNILKLSKTAGMSVLLGNLDHANTAWILRALRNDSIGMASPPFLHINCRNLRIPKIALQEKWQKEEIALSQSIRILEEMYMWENALAPLKNVSSKTNVSVKRGKLFVLSSGYWLRKKLNHGDSARISEFAAIEFQVMQMVRDRGIDAEVLAHPREFKFPKEMKLHYPIEVMPNRSLDDVGIEEYAGAYFLGCQSTAFNSCLRLKDLGVVYEVLMVVPKSWMEWSLNELSIGESIITLEKLSHCLDKMH